MNKLHRSKANTPAKLWPWTVGLAALVGVAFAWSLLPLGDWLQSFSQWIQGLGALGITAFAAAYILGTVLLVPAALMTIAAGLAYGWWALPLVLVAASAGATLAFLLGRTLLQAKVQQAVKARRTLRAAAEAVDDEGWKVLVLLRLSPVVPFGAQNYVIGATNIALITFVLATVGGIAPGTVIYVYLGVIGATAGQGGGAARWGFLVAGLVATVAVTALVSVKAKAKLREKGIAKAS